MLLDDRRFKITNTLIMKGYLYNIMGKGIEELYWSEKEIEEYLLKEAWKNWESSEYYDDMEFEEFWNIGTSQIKIERIYLEEIYV